MTLGRRQGWHDASLCRLIAHEAGAFPADSSRKEQLGMKPVHAHFDDLLKGRIDRRTFFKRAAAAGAVTPVIADYLA